MVFIERPILYEGMFVLQEWTLLHGTPIFAEHMHSQMMDQCSSYGKFEWMTGLTCSSREAAGFESAGWSKNQLVPLVGWWFISETSSSAISIINYWVSMSWWIW